jgi:hypothetical protein
MRRVLLAAILVAAASAFGVASAQDQGVELAGEIKSLARPTGALPGVMVVGVSRVEIPPDLAVDLPAARLTLDQVFAEAPPGCVARGESGLASGDACRTNPDGSRADATAPGREPETLLSVASARVLAARADDGRLVASRVQITRSSEPLWGGVTFVSPTDGYMRINGALREDDGGTVVRINDPTKQQSDQHGPGCGSLPNCSPDPRFRAALSPWSVRFEQGNPACIGADDQGCHASNRDTYPGDLVTLVPIRVGDNVLVEGSYESVRGVAFFSAQSLLVQTRLGKER